MARQTCTNCTVFSKSYFNILSEKDLQELNEKKTSLFFKRNQTIFTAGTRPNGIYCLCKGKVKLYKTGAFGKEQILRFALPGEWFGLRAMVSDEYYTTTAVAIEDSVICSINKQDFQLLLDKYPQITASIITALSEMLETANNKLTSLAQKPVRERLAETLVALEKVFTPETSDNNSSTVVSLSRQDLANLAGTATETVIRLLSEFKTDGIISIQGRKITILDNSRLKRIANL